MIGGQHNVLVGKVKHEGEVVSQLSGKWTEAVQYTDPNKVSQADCEARWSRTPTQRLRVVSMSSSIARCACAEGQQGRPL